MAMNTALKKHGLVQLAPVKISGKRSVMQYMKNAKRHIRLCGWLFQFIILPPTCIPDRYIIFLCSPQCSERYNAVDGSCEISELICRGGGSAGCRLDNLKPPIDGDSIRIRFEEGRK